MCKITPKDWKVFKVNDILTFSTAPSKSKFREENGRYLIMDMGAISKTGKNISYKRTNLNENILDVGDLVMPKDDIGGGFIIGKTAFIDEANKYVLGDHVYLLKINKKVCDPLFVHYKFNSHAYNRKLKRLVTGSAQLGITSKNIMQEKFIAPPLKEQQKIASILSSVDEAIGKTKEIIKKTELVKKSLMNQLLIKGIKHINFKDSVFGKVPEEWRVLQLEDVTSYEDKYSFVGGPFGSDLTAKEYTEHGVRIVQLQNIGDGKFYDNYKIYTSKEKADQLYKSNIFPGDIIIAKMADPVARACIIPDKEDRYLMASDGIRLKVDENKFNKKFILYAINSSYFRKQAINHSTGTTRLRIGLKTLRSLKVLIPSLMEQQKIVSILDSYENKLNVESNKLENLISIKRGLMQQLLTGKIRVPTTENKEVPQ